MPYPIHIEQKLEFDQIRILLGKKCLSELGLSYLEKIKFVNRFDVLEKMLLQTHEFKAILTSDTPFPSEHYYNVEPYLKKASISGMFLQEEEWHQLKLLMQSFQQICKYFEDRSEIYVQLFALFGGISVNVSIIRNIEKVIDETGKLKPNASPELAKISSKINEKEKEIRKRVNQIYEKANAAGWVADSGISIREGRLVIPVLAEFKRNIPGFVHDESATGQTVFIEPTEAFENNNLLRELQIAYRREREKILTDLTDKLRPDIPEVTRYMTRMGLADFIRAKALFAIELDASMPILKREPKLNLQQAFHPLLKISHAKNGLQVVSLEVILNKENRILVISGPNAGGKSVCLKTIGLLQFMLQCGLLIPCAAHSECGIFSEIMVDIGDEQSIENDLSTYSSHLKHMRYFTDFANGSTLFLIDEFGTGTDPLFGGPLAEAILNKLNQKAAYGVVTTHYSNLKNFASNTKGLENACMLFDNQQMIPMYKLEMGKPGSSYAFEIATKSGLQSDVIAYAKSKVGDKQKHLDDLLIELEREKKHINELKARYTKKEEESKKLLEVYSILKNELETNKKKLISDAKKEALSIISEANSRIENTIREIREKKADTEIIRKVRNELKTETEEIKTHIIPTAKPKSNFINSSTQELTIGATVTLEGQKETGEIEEINRNKALVAFGSFRTWIELNRLIVVIKQGKTTTKSSLQGIDINDKLKHFNTELNIIGVRGEEAIKQLQQYLDDAYILGFKQVKIVHGKGYGILRKLVREYLKKSKHVVSVSDEHIEMGGDGVSVVEMKQ